MCSASTLQTFMAAVLWSSNVCWRVVFIHDEPPAAHLSETDEANEPEQTETSFITVIGGVSCVCVLRAGQQCAIWLRNMKDVCPCRGSGGRWMKTSSIWVAAGSTRRFLSGRCVLSLGVEQLPVLLVVPESVNTAALMSRTSETVHWVCVDGNSFPFVTQ